MREAVKNAVAAGIPKTEIAELAGLSRQSIYDILESE
jgi:sugar-specific transcriptional regulator TrmB